MILQDWLKELDYTLIQGNPDTQVEEVIYDSRKAGPGTVFVAMTGTRIDAHCFIPDVLKAGTRILVTERPIDMELEACELDEEEKKKITILRVKDSRRALALLSAARFGYPAKKLTLIGVTGTKGKTTTTHMIKTVLEAAGKKAGLIGTTGVVIGEHVTPTMNTTPESYELHKAFAQMAEAGCDYAVMEVSSQGVKMHRVDAHRFICQAISAGAETVFTSCHHSEKEVREAIESQCREHPEWSGQALLSTWICVEDTKAALQALGAWCRSQAQIPLVGITGSVGKTTTREMVACALSAGYRVYKTPGNSNSQVGVPITVFNIPKEAQIGVIELGMSEPGEMTKIAQVAQTDCAVMTNIGVAHIEQLGSKENILKEKLHIQDGMAEDGVLFLNGDDPLLRAVMPNQGRSRILYGLWEGCDCRGENLHLENGFPVFTAVCKEERVQVHLKVMGNHMVSNALAALAVASRYGIPLQLSLIHI